MKLGKPIEEFHVDIHYRTCSLEFLGSSYGSNSIRRPRRVRSRRWRREGGREEGGSVEIHGNILAEVKAEAKAEGKTEFTDITIIHVTELSEIIAIQS